MPNGEIPDWLVNSDGGTGYRLDALTIPQLISILSNPTDYPQAPAFTRSSPSLFYQDANTYAPFNRAGAILPPLQELTPEIAQQAYDPSSRYYIPGLIREGDYIDPEATARTQALFKSWLVSSAPWVQKYETKLQELARRQQEAEDVKKAQALQAKIANLQARLSEAKQPYEEAMKAWYGESEEPFTLDDLLMLNKAWRIYQKQAAETDVLTNALLQGQGG